jgi:hypothetical protein
VGDDGIAGQLLQEGFDVGAGGEPDEIDAGGGIRLDDHAADFVEQALELVVGGAGFRADEQFVLHEFGRGAPHAPGGVETGRFPGHGAGGRFAAGGEDADFLQFGDAAEGPPEHFPGEQVVIGVEQGNQGVIHVGAPEGGGDGGFDAGIDADLHADAGELVEDLDQGGGLGLQPEAFAIEAEIEGGGGARAEADERKSDQTQ